MKNNWRNTSQFLMPAIKPKGEKGRYYIYPTHVLEDGKIDRGFESLVNEFKQQRTVLIDGFTGVFFEVFRKNLQEYFDHEKLKVHWIDTSVALKYKAEIDKLIAPFLGGNDPLFGTRTTMKLADFFQQKKLKSLPLDGTADLNIIFGVGAQLTEFDGLLVYIDLPKNELQFRARAKAVTNLGASKPDDIKPMYKRYYFVDWPVLNCHKKQILPIIDIFVDGQRTD